jgi:peptide deformylase
MAVREIMMLGNPVLLKPCEPVQKGHLDEARQVAQDLHDTLADFHARCGWGRGISAPQIGVLKCIVCLQVDHPLTLLNPEFSEHSTELLTLWDDCMSFPDLLVQVRRHARLTLTYRDLDWAEHRLALDGAMAELLQHEVDHLDGILAVMRAVDGAAFALRSQVRYLGAAAFANPA